MNTSEQRLRALLAEAATELAASRLTTELAKRIQDELAKPAEPAWKVDDTGMIISSHELFAIECQSATGDNGEGPYVLDTVLAGRVCELLNASEQNHQTISLINETASSVSSLVSRSAARLRENLEDLGKGWPK